MSTQFRIKYLAVVASLGFAFHSAEAKGVKASKTASTSSKKELRTSRVNSKVSRSLKTRATLKVGDTSGLSKSALAKTDKKSSGVTGINSIEGTLRQSARPSRLVPLSIPTEINLDSRVPNTRIDKTIKYLRSAAFSLQAPVTAMVGSMKLTVRPGQSKMDVIGDYRARKQGHQGQYLSQKNLKNASILEAVTREATMAGYTNPMVFAVHHLRGKAEISAYHDAIRLEGKAPQLARTFLREQRSTSQSATEIWYQAFETSARR